MERQIKVIKLKKEKPRFVPHTIELVIDTPAKAAAVYSILNASQYSFSKFNKRVGLDRIQEELEQSNDMVFETNEFAAYRDFLTENTRLKDV